MAEYEIDEESFREATERPVCIVRLMCPKCYGAYTESGVYIAYEILCGLHDEELESTDLSACRGQNLV